MIFIWKRKGFLTPLFLIGVMGGFGAVLTLTFGDQLFDNEPWLYGIGWLLAAVVNWYGGRKINRRPLWPEWRSRRPKNPLGAANTFCFVAMDYWSIPAAALGVGLLVTGLLNRSPSAF